MPAKKGAEAQICSDELKSGERKIYLDCFSLTPSIYDLKKNYMKKKLERA